MARAAQVIWALAGWTLLLAMPALWGLSYLRGHSILWLSGGQRSLMLCSHQGRLGATLVGSAGPSTQPPQFVHVNDSVFAELTLRWDLDNGYVVHGWENLHWSSCPPNTAGPYIAGATIVVLPHWLLSMPALLLFALAARHGVRRRRRRKRGLCLACGYDLRHSPNRCPECGTAVGTKGATHANVATDPA